MTGSYQGNSVALTQAHWIHQPLGYVMVSLQGQVSGADLSGSIIGPGCSTFSVSRVTPTQALLAWYQQHGDIERYEMLAATELIVTNVELGIPSESDQACGIGSGVRSPVLEVQSLTDSAFPGPGGFCR
jgi:hypothetical protein